MPHSVAAPIKSPNTDQAPHQQPVPEPEDTLMSERAASPDPTSSLAAKHAQEEEQRQLIEGPPANTPPLDILLKKHFLRSHPGPLDESILLDYLSFMWAVDPHTFCKKSSHLVPFGAVLQAWIDWRRHAIQVKEHIGALPANNELGWIFRGAICSELRGSRDKFMEKKVEIDGKKMEARNVISTAFANAMSLDAKKNLQIVKLLRERVCGEDPELVVLQSDPRPSLG